MSRLDESYSAPTKAQGNYFKPSEAKTKIRIMGKPITWWLDRSDKKPVRTKDQPKSNFDDEKPAKHFRATAVWNYGTERLELWEIPQSSVREQIDTLIKWERGNPTQYDLIVWKEWKAMDTRYFVATTPAGIKAVDEAIEAKYNETPINLQALFDGGNPRAEVEAKF